MGVNDVNAIIEGINRANDPNNFAPRGLRSLSAETHRQRMPRPNLTNPTIPYQSVDVNPTFNRTWQNRDAVYSHLDTRRLRNKGDGSFQSTPSVGAALINYVTARSARKEGQRAAAAAQAAAAEAYRKSPAGQSAAFLNAYGLTNSQSQNEQSPADAHLSQLYKNVFTPQPRDTTPFAPTADPWQQVTNKINANRAPQFVDPSVSSRIPFAPTADPLEQLTTRVNASRVPQFIDPFISQSKKRAESEGVSQGINAAKLAYTKPAEEREGLALAKAANPDKAGPNIAPVNTMPSSSGPSPAPVNPVSKAAPTKAKVAASPAPTKQAAAPVKETPAPKGKPRAKAAAKANIQKEKTD